MRFGQSWWKIGCVDNVWTIALNGVEEPDQGIYEAMSKTQKDNLLVDKKNNATTLCPIQEAMYESILPKICNSQRGLGYFEHEFWCKGEQLF